MSHAPRETPALSHLDEQGRAQMVDVGHKAVTERLARARGQILMSPATLDLIRAGSIAKGDALAVARVAGIQAAKRTAELIPLCHPLPLSQVRIEIEPREAPSGLVVTATVKTSARTGVEMEALTAASVALLSLYDMAKGVERGMRITELQLLEKRGGMHGDWTSEEPD